MGKKIKQQVPAQQEPNPIVKKLKKPTIVTEVVEEVQTSTKLHAIKLARLQSIRSKLPKFLHFDVKQVQKAVSILKSTVKKNNILDIGDDFVYLEIVLNRVPQKHSIRPVQIALPVPIYTEEMNSKFCIFCKNPQRKYKDFISEMNIPLVQRVVEYAKISKKFPTYNDRRKLFYEYDMFFCDKTIYPLLAKCTGKIFYERKKIPFPIDGDKVPEDVQRDIKSSKYEDYLKSLAKYTYFSQGNGPVQYISMFNKTKSTLKVARVGFSEDDVVKNIMQGCYNVLPYLFLEQGMDLSAVRLINIKLSQSVTLPIYAGLSDREVQVWQSQKSK